MLEELTSGEEAFVPRARLLKLIGSELISDEVVAVTELVKNAHDADASTVTISFRGVTGPDGEIVVSDDGHGMGREVLLERWMQPASSGKRGEAGRRTGRGRRVLGEKGVGRFAADKLASRLELLSRREGDRLEIRAEFDWDRFEAEHLLLSDVKCQWELQPAQTLNRSGTILSLRGLRCRWTERMFRRLCTRLARLISPFDGRSDFSIRVESDDFPDYSGELRTGFLEQAPYRIEASWDGSRDIEMGIRGELPVRSRWNGQTPLTCGPVKVHLYAFDLETESIARIGPRIEVRAWLREWSGISVYRDGFRVWPYGEPHDDWLRLDQRRVNNPVVCLSNNQVVGFVELSADRNPELRDQTNREGLIHNSALDDLRRLVHFVLHQLETDRQRLRHPSSRKSTTTMAKRSGVGDAVADEVDRLAGMVSGEVANELRQLARKARESREREQASQQRFIDGLSDLASLGQVAVGARSAVLPLLATVRERCDLVWNQLNGNGTRALKQSLEAVDALLDRTFRRLSVLAPLESGISARRRTIDIASELEDLQDVLEPVLQESDVAMLVEAPRRGMLRVEMRPETLARLMHILATNSIDWLRGVEERRIRIQAWAEDEKCSLLFSDTGPGIPTANAERVFEPFFSTREGGQGMGLTIARSIVALHGGSIEVLTDQRRRGANIRVVLPRRRSRATIT